MSHICEQCSANTRRIESLEDARDDEREARQTFCIWLAGVLFGIGLAVRARSRG